MDRIVNVYKTRGLSSHDCVYKLRKITGIKKIGHTGTLDPLAEGVLPICIGRATKVCEYMLEKEKEYICEATLGFSTDTDDLEGNVLEESGYENVDEDMIIEALNSFEGESMQTPPIYSALKQDGKKLYELAREGKADLIKQKSRSIYIHEIEPVSIDIPKITFRCRCSKGTYMRSICRDLGERLGTRAHMSSLIRTASGPFTKDTALTLEQIDEIYKKILSSDKKASEALIEKYFFKPDFPLIDYRSCEIKDNATRYYLNGGRIEVRRVNLTDSEGNAASLNEGELIKTYYKNEFIGIGRIENIEGELFVKPVKRITL